jgi:acetolactate decarboxylase
MGRARVGSGGNGDQAQCADPARLPLADSFAKLFLKRRSIPEVQMAQISAEIPDSLKAALEERAARSGGISSIVTTALARYLEEPIHTIFQVSTSGALVAGVDDREVSVKTLLEHGDFGLGTFADLDGEMVVVDGRTYQIHGTGSVAEAPPNAGAPFAVVTWFDPRIDASIGAVGSFKDLEASCDNFRRSGNIFYAFRLDGRFKIVHARAVNSSKARTGLVDAAKAQSEFSFADLEGTLIGLWSPGFSSAFSVPGYHFHFLSADYQHGGHLLDLVADQLRLRVEPLTDFHLVLPETEAFLKADLSKDTTAQLAYAEKAH